MTASPYPLYIRRIGIYTKQSEGKTVTVELLISPGIFKDGWKPTCLNGKLEAAAVPGYDAVSGWDLARGGPKPNRFTAKAGSVYFLDEKINNLPETLADSKEDRLAGWGAFLKGVYFNE